MRQVEEEEEESLAPPDAACRESGPVAKTIVVI